MAQRWSAPAFVALWCALVVLQGGFYPAPSLAVGLGALALALCGARSLDRHRIAVAALIATAGAVCCLSALANGLDMSSVLVGCVLALSSAPALLPGALGPQGRSGALLLLGRAGVVGAALGVLMFAGVVPWPGAVHAGRLQFFLQYANGAGILFATLLLASADARDRFIESGRPLLVMALGLTASVGAVLCTLVGLAVLAAARRRSEEAAGREAGLLTDVLLGGVAALCAFAWGPVGTCAGALGAVGCRMALDRWVRRLVGASPRTGLGPAILASAVPQGRRARIAAAPQKRRARIAALCAVAVLAAAGLLALGPARLAQAAGTLAERLDQMGDALALWAGAPLLGVGPDGWQHLYQGVQSTDYVSSVVHSSFLQIALDGGLLALAPFCAACILGLRAAIKEGEFCIAAATITLLLHALLDFDLRFAALFFLLTFLLGYAANAPSKPKAT